MRTAAKPEDVQTGREELVHVAHPILGWSPLRFKEYHFQGGSIEDFCLGGYQVKYQAVKVFDAIGVVGGATTGYVGVWVPMGAVFGMAVGAGSSAQRNEESHTY